MQACLPSWKVHWRSAFPVREGHLFHGGSGGYPSYFFDETIRTGSEKDVYLLYIYFLSLPNIQFLYPVLFFFYFRCHLIMGPVTPMHMVM